MFSIEFIDDLEWLIWYKSKLVAPFQESEPSSDLSKNNLT